MLTPLAERYNASAMSLKALPRPVLRFSALLFALTLPSLGPRGLAHALDAGSATASPAPEGRAGEGAPSSPPLAREPGGAAGAREARPRPLPFGLPETLRPLLKTRKLRLANAWGGYALRGSASAVAVGGGRGVAAGPSGTRIWDLDTGRQLHLLPAGQDGAGSVAIALDGRLVATGGHDGTVLLWDVEGGRVRALLRRHAGDVSALAFSRDGRALASGGADGVVRVWEVARGRGAQVLFGHKDVVRALAFSPDGRGLFSAGDDGSVRVWDLARGRLLRTLGPVDGAEVTALAIAEDGRRALAAEDGRGVRLWDLEAGLPLGLFEDVVGALALAFAPDGTRALAARTTRREGYPAGDRTGPGLPELEVRAWDPSGTGAPRSFSRRHDGLSAAAFSADAALLLSSEGGALRLWDVKQGRERRETSGHAGAVACVALSPDGTRAITAAADHTARLWDVGSGSELFVFGGYVEQVRSAAFSPTGKLALVADLAGTQKLWDLETGDQVRQLGVHRGLQTVGFLKDGLSTFSASCDRIALWDVASGKEAGSIAFSKVVDRVAFSPGGGLALSFGSIDGPQLWDLSTGKVIQTLARPHRHARAAALSPDGKMAAVATAPAEIGAGADVIELWGVGGGLLPPSLRAREGVEALAFSPDGRLLLSASAPGDVSLYSLTLRREVSHLELGPNAERPTALAFGADGLSLLVGTSLGGILHFLISEDPLR
jgi:WD40 repeat protein